MKIRRHHCKKGLKTRKGSEFDSDLWESNKDIALQSRKVLQMFVWWWWCFFALFKCITFKLGKLNNFKALFCAVLLDTAKVVVMTTC